MMSRIKKESSVGPAGNVAKCTPAVSGSFGPQCRGQANYPVSGSCYLFHRQLTDVYEHSWCLSVYPHICL